LGERETVAAFPNKGEMGRGGGKRPDLGLKSKGKESLRKEAVMSDVLEARENLLL